MAALCPVWAVNSNLTRKAAALTCFLGLQNVLSQEVTSQHLPQDYLPLHLTLKTRSSDWNKIWGRLPLMASELRVMAS